MLLYRYILRQVAVPSVLALAVISFVTVANEIRERVDPAGAAVVQTAMQQISALDFLHVGVLFLPAVIIYVIPITYMMGILMAFGRLAEDNEITAMRAAGAPLKRIILPVLAGGALLTVGSFLLQDRVQPPAVMRAHHLMFVEIPLRITLDKLPAGTMHQVDGWRFYIGDKDPETQTLYDINILVPERDGGAWVYHAGEAQVFQEGWEASLELRNGHIIFPEEGGRLARSTFDRWVLTTPDFIPDRPARDRRAMSLAQLLERERELSAALAEEGDDQANADELRRIRNEIGERAALPFACLVVSVMAAPLAARRRAAGKSYSFAIGAGVFLAYYLLTLAFDRGGLLSLEETVLRAFAPNFVLLAVGAWLVWRVDRV